MHKSFVFLRMYHKLELSCESTCAKTYHTCTQWHNSIVTPANQSTCAKAFRTCTQWHNSIVTPANQSTCAKAYRTCTQWHNSRPIVTPANQSTCAKAYRTCTQWHNSIVTPANQSTCAKTYRTCTQWHNGTVNRPIKAHVLKHTVRAPSDITLLLTGQSKHMCQSIKLKPPLTEKLLACWSSLERGCRIKIWPVNSLM